jgi:hypothetical protein
VTDPLPFAATSSLLFIAYPAMTQTIIETSGFPAGYFIVRSVASKRLLDVAGDGIEDGTEIVLWPEKEKSLVES